MLAPSRTRRLEFDIVCRSDPVLASLPKETDEAGGPDQRQMEPISKVRSRHTRIAVILPFARGLLNHMPSSRRRRRL
jgi:hypothetical protein